MGHEKWPKKIALAVLASDALSSIAYAPGELMYQFVFVGAIAGLAYSVPLAIAIAIVVGAVISLYREVIKHYPGGGGGYTVVKSNLGPFPSLVTASSLLMDYVLTVSVSVASGVAQLEEVAPMLKGHRVGISCLVIVFIAYMNLRGYRESGRFFAVWTYGFIGIFSVLLISGLAASLTGTLPHVSVAPSGSHIVGAVTLFLMLRAFASGATALTGIEAISNGVPIFREPQQNNARATLLTLGTIIVVFLIGSTVLVRAVGLIPENPETLIPQVGGVVFPALAVMLPFPFMPWVANVLLVLLTSALAVILLIAANTAFTDLPMVCANLARDGYLPRQFRNRGDRQVFSTGILTLTVLSILPIYFFAGNVSALIPLYGIGVFLNFTLVAVSMIKHSLNRTPRNWYGFGVSIVAGVMSAIVLAVFVVTKFGQGGYIILLILPMVIVIMRKIKRNYDFYAKTLALQPEHRFTARPASNTIVIAIGGVNKTALKAYNRASDIKGRKIVLHVAYDEEDERRFHEEWRSLRTGVEPVVLRSEYNSATSPILDFVRNLQTEEDAKEAKDPSYVHHLYIVIAEMVPRAFFAHLLYNQTAFFLYNQLRAMPEVTPLLVRYVPEKIPLGERIWGTRPVAQQSELPALADDESIDVQPASEAV